jgi:DNA-binding response OmpR family regulator
MSAALTAQVERIKAQPHEEADVYDDAWLRIEHKNYYVACGGEHVYLRRKEFLIISYLARNIGSIVPDLEIWTHAWSASSPFNYIAFRVTVHRLRRTLKPYNIRIKNSPNNGYELVSDSNNHG